MVSEPEEVEEDEVTTPPLNTGGFCVGGSRVEGLTWEKAELRLSQSWLG